MNSTLAILDWWIIAAYFALILGVAWRVSQQQKDTSNDYFLAGRNLGWLIVGASIFASNIGSEHLVGLAGSGATDGVAMAHYELHAWCLLVLGWIMAPFYMRSRVFTMPEFLEKRFSSTARWVLSLISLVAYVLTKVAVGIFAGASFLVMTLTPSVQGFWANSEHFVIFFAMGSFLLMMIALDNEDKRSLFLSGVLLGISILIKQHAIFFWMFGFFYLMYCKKQTEDFADIFSKAPIFLTGTLTPVIPVFFIYYATGNFDEFWFWTVKYAFAYVSYFPLNEAVGKFVYTFTPILNNNFWILFLSLLGVVSVYWDKTIRSKYAFFFGLLVFSFIAITPGFYFREHYFILLMNLMHCSKLK